VADGWCWFVLREKYCWLIAGGWFVLREKYCWLVADKPSEQGVIIYVIKFHLVAIVKSLDVLLDKPHNICHQALSCVDGEIT
jgi:hypothetical protein